MRVEIYKTSEEVTGLNCDSEFEFHAIASSLMN